MLDPFDYKEPSCAVCGGKEFYYPDENIPSGYVPVRSVLSKFDAAVAKNDYAEGERILEYWEKEARALRDRHGLLTVLSEMMGLYRKTGKKEKGLAAVKEGIEAVRALNLSDSVSGATVLLNAATTMKAFGMAVEALPIYDEVKAVYAKRLDATDMRIAGLCNNAALAYADVGEKGKAEELYLRALSVLAANEKTENEVAVTYINLAHLYENTKGKEDDVYACVEKAIEYLDSPNVEHNGYHAFTCTKCAPSIGYFGYFAAQERLEARAKEIYERT